MPLSIFLKNFFAVHKKYGSTDRKQITQLCFGFYRLGKSLEHLTKEDKLKISIFLCNSNCQNFSFLFDDFWKRFFDESLDQKLSFLKEKIEDFEIENILNSYCEINDLIDKKSLGKAYLKQPNLYLRIRPTKENIVLQKLRNNKVEFELLKNNCLILQNNIKLENILEINKEAVVQDYSSQQIQYFLEIVKSKLLSPIKLWDCCAASGGKSILANDVLSKPQITVSDVRPSILHNLKNRLASAGVNIYNLFVADLSKPIKHNSTYNFIICDVPCSGSGTWCRTPEQNYFFKKSTIENFIQLQKNIAINALQYLQNGGYFLYITCSVFSKENDDVLQIIMDSNSKLELVEKKYFLGYNTQADSLFGALFKKTI